MVRMANSADQLAQLTPVLMNEINYAFQKELGDFSGKYLNLRMYLLHRAYEADRVERNYRNELLWQRRPSSSQPDIDWSGALSRREIHTSLYGLRHVNFRDRFSHSKASTRSLPRFTCMAIIATAQVETQPLRYDPPSNRQGANGSQSSDS